MSDREPLSIIGVVCSCLGIWIKPTGLPIISNLSLMTLHRVMMAL